MRSDEPSVEEEEEEAATVLAVSGTAMADGGEGEDEIQFLRTVSGLRFSGEEVYETKGLVSGSPQPCEHRLVPSWLREGIDVNGREIGASLIILTEKKKVIHSTHLFTQLSDTNEC